MDEDKLKYYSIGEVSDLLDVKESTLRYWEKEFKILKPGRTESNRRIYSDKDIEVIKRIIYLLNDLKYTIAGAREEIEKEKKIKHEKAELTKSKTGIEKKGKNTKKIKEELKDILEILDLNRKKDL